MKMNDQESLDMIRTLSTLVADINSLGGIFAAGCKDGYVAYFEMSGSSLMVRVWSNEAISSADGKPCVRDEIEFRFVEDCVTREKYDAAAVHLNKIYEAQKEAVARYVK